jgi:glycosyltransferase involved in cell wall biosynthesis
LQALADQSRPADEVVVVHRHDDDASRHALDEVSRWFPEGRLVMAMVDRPGLEAALNAGLEKATGDVICFSDDDAAPHRDWLEKIEEHFLRDPALGGVGGRDMLVVDGQRVTGTCRVVHRLTWFGRLIGNNHLQLVPSRVVEAHSLKGVNMSFRASYLEGFRFDENCIIGGTTTNDLDVSLHVRGRGGRLIYDPDVVVDHFNAPREYGVPREANRDVYCYSYNTVYVLLKYLPWPRKVAMLLYYFLIGQRASWGLVTVILDPILRRRVAWRGQVLLSLRGKLDGVLAYMRWRRGLACYGTERVPQA